MGSVEVVEVLPLFQASVEKAGVVDHDALEHPVELLLVDPVAPLDLPVQPGRSRPDVDVTDPAVKHVVVELRPELRAVEFLTDVKPLRRP